MKIIEIGGRKIGVNYPPFIVAELSANHNGDLQKALDTMTMAKKCGVDAIKLQTYTPDTMTIDCDKDEFQIKGGLWNGYKLYDLYQWAQTPFEWHQVLFEHAKSIAIICFSTPCDETAVDLLEKFDVPAYKIASFEATDIPLIRYIASKKRPIIMSTGMADLSEIEEAVAAVREGGCEDLILLHGISSYPAPVEQSNLLTIPDMAAHFNLQVGLSDHTITNTAAVTSIALGATVIEKHFTLDRNEKGPDSGFSIEPDELKSLCVETNEAWRALGKAGYERKPAEEVNIKFRRSVYFVKNMEAGETITSQHIRRIRPGFGLPPKFFDQLIGRTVKQNIERGTATSWDLIDE